MFSDEFQQQVNQYFAQEKYLEAIAFLESKILECPDNNCLYCYLGLAWFLLGEDSKAADIWFTVILEQSEAETAQFIELLINTANGRLRQRKFEQAVGLYEQILQLDDSQPEIYFNYGNALAQEGDIDSAIEAWQDATKLQDNYQQAHHNLAAAWQKLGDYSLAVGSYEVLLRVNPKDYNTLYNLGLCYVHINQLDRAIECFQHCLEINPSFTPAYGDLGYILADQGYIDKAIASWQKWLAIDPNFILDYTSWIDNLVTQNLPIDNSVIANANFLKSLKNGNDTNDINRSFSLLKSCLKPLSNPPSLLSDSIHLSHHLPNGYYNTTKEWADSWGGETDNYLPIYPENSLHLNPPHTKDEYIHYSYRFGEQVTLPESFITIIPEGRFWLSEEEASSAVITADGKILGDLSPETPFLSPRHPDSHPSKHSIFQLPSLSTPEYIDGKVAVLAGVLNNIYFHWIFDILPRFALLSSGEAKLDINTIDYFFVSNNLPFQKESLTKLGIDPSKIIGVDRHKHIQAKELIVPSFPGSVAWMPQWTCDFLRKMFLDLSYSNLEQNKLIYISRKKSGGRRLINEEEIINILDKKGFTFVDLETMSIQEQALLLSQAKVVISPHGSGLTNLVFCREGTKVIEIFSPYYVYPCYWLISNLVGLEYSYLLGENPEGFFLHHLFYPSSRVDDIWLNPQRLLELI
jgi:tetratricopeptide (TPR) repeat protein